MNKNFMEFNKDGWDKFIANKNPLLISSFKSFDHCLDHYKRRQNEDDRRFCIVELDQAVELLFKGVLLRSGKNPYKMWFETLQKQVKPILGLTNDEDALVSRLHEKRNASQHEGEIPDLNQTVHLVHLVFRFLLDKTQKHLGYSPDNMRDKIPNLLSMEIEQIEPKLPEKPEILRYLEGAITHLLVLGNAESAFSHICVATARVVDIIYQNEIGPPLGSLSPEPTHTHVNDYDPQQVIKREMRSLGSSIQGDFQRVVLKWSEIPFRFAPQVELIPGSIPAIEEMSRIERKHILGENDLAHIYTILRLDLLRSLKPRFPEKERKLAEGVLKAKLQFDFVFKEYLFLRQFIWSQPAVFKTLQGYFDELNSAFVGAFRNKHGQR